MEDNQKERVYTQAEVDAIIAKKEARFETKVGRDYVDKNEYETLKGEVDYLKGQAKIPALKEEYLKQGGREEAFGDFVALNGEALKGEPSKFGEVVKAAKQNKAYMFSKDPIQVDLPISLTSGKVTTPGGAKTQKWWDFTNIRRK